MDNYKKDFKARKEYKKQQTINALAKIIKQKHAEIGNDTDFYTGYGLNKKLIADLEKGKREAKFSTILKLACAFNLKCSEFIKLLEEEI